jgi:hypothetical protein
LGKELPEATHLETMKIQGEINNQDAEVLAEGLATNLTLTCLDSIVANVSFKTKVPLGHWWLGFVVTRV